MPFMAATPTWRIVRKRKGFHTPVPSATNALRRALR